MDLINRKEMDIRSVSVMFQNTPNNILEKKNRLSRIIFGSHRYICSIQNHKFLFQNLRKLNKPAKTIEMSTVQTIRAVGGCGLEIVTTSQTLVFYAPTNKSQTEWIVQLQEAKKKVSRVKSLINLNASLTSFEIDDGPQQQHLQTNKRSNVAPGELRPSNSLQTTLVNCTHQVKKNNSDENFAERRKKDVSLQQSNVDAPCEDRHKLNNDSGISSINEFECDESTAGMTCHSPNNTNDAIIRDPSNPCSDIRCQSNVEALKIYLKENNLFITSYNTGDLRSSMSNLKAFLKTI